MRVAIIGAGPAGVMAGINLVHSDCEVTFFDDKLPLSTLLPTGGGRCNLAFAEFDNRELINYYPRGGKFLLSVFSRFSTGDTIEFFKSIGVSTYIQEDLRIFPKSNSAKDVRDKLLAKLRDKKVYFEKEKVVDIIKKGNNFGIYTKKAQYSFDKVVFAGGIKNNYQLLSKMGVELIEPRPALCAICVENSDLYSLSGVVLKNVFATVDKKLLDGDILITHKALSGPLAYKISATCAYAEFPYVVKLNLVKKSFEEFDVKLIETLEKNPKKDLLNIISDFVPRSFAQYLLKNLDVSESLKANQVSKIIRNKISRYLCEYELVVVSQKADGEIVTAGGVNLNCINPKTMEYKKIEGLYFCGEVLNIDGFTGGFNLQNCWSTGFIVGTSLSKM